MPEKKTVLTTSTLESTAYLGGLFQDFAQQIARYKDYTAHLRHLEARLELAEKTLALTRDHLRMALETTEGCGTGSGSLWEKYAHESAKVRFVGVRLVDACEQVLAEEKNVTPERLLDLLNSGGFRFRTNAPLREIHAALIRHTQIRRVEDFYIWAGSKEDRLAVLEAAATEPGHVIEGEVKPEKETGAKPN